MKITNKIIDSTCFIKINGPIIGMHAVELNNLIKSTNFSQLGINKLVFDFTKVGMIDSIGLETVHEAQEKGLQISILNPQESVKDMLDRAQINKRLSPFLQIVRENHKSFNRKEPNILKSIPISC
jgi:anti-anti-sigma factor